MSAGLFGVAVFIGLVCLKLPEANLVNFLLLPALCALNVVMAVCFIKKGA